MIEYIAGGTFKHVVTVTYRKNGLLHMSPMVRHALLHSLHGKQMIDDKFAAMMKRFCALVDACRKKCGTIALILFQLTQLKRSRVTMS